MMQKLTFLLTEKKFDQAIDFIYDELDDRLLDRKFDEINEILQSMVRNEYSTDILLSILTVTLPWKKDLSERKRIIEKVRKQHNEVESELLLLGLL